jgi:hypothetical protein
VSPPDQFSLSPDTVDIPERGPEVRRVLEELLAVLDRTSTDGVI